MLNKAPSLFLAAQVSLFSFLFPPFQTQHTNDHAVSACHGAGDDPISPTCYPSRFFQGWNTVFPRPATELTNGALRRTNSGTLGTATRTIFQIQTDLVIIELDTEDEPFVSLPFLLFLFRFFRFSSVSFVSLPFLSYHPFSFRFCSLSVCCDRLAPTLHMPFYRHPPWQTTDFPTPTRVDAHPARLLIYPLPWLRHGFTLFTYSIQL